MNYLKHILNNNNKLFLLINKCKIIRNNNIIANCNRRFIHLSKYRTDDSSAPSLPLEELKLMIMNMQAKHINAKTGDIKDDFMGGPVNLIVVSNGFAGTPKSFLIQSKHTNYLFNCPEGTQRLFNSNNMKLIKTENIFITRKSWDTLGGLIGLYLTLQNIGTQPTLHGPFNVNELFSETSVALRISRVNFSQHNYASGDFDDPILTVKPIEFRLDGEALKTQTEKVASKSPSNIVDEYSSDISDSERAEGGSSEPEAKRMCVEMPKFSNTSIYSYLITIKRQQPKLLQDKLIQYRVPFGKMRGLLKNGIDVTLPNGNVIYAKDVLDYTDCDDKKVVVIDCPNENYFKFIKENEHINDTNVKLIVHMSDSRILNSGDYQEWLKSKTYCNHLILDETRENIHSEKLYRYHKTLNHMDKNIFPLLYNMIEDENICENKELIVRNENYFYGISGLKMNLRSTNEIDTNLCHRHVKMNAIIDGLREEYPYIDFETVLTTVKNEVKKYREGITIKSEDELYPKVVFLGTGSSVPSSKRNVSGILIEIDDQTNIILDCGEGTLGQLIGLYKTEYENALRKLKAIFISHYHEDHHLGLFKIIHERKLVFNRLNIDYEKLYLLLPANTCRWFNVIKDFYGPEYTDYVSILVNKWLYPKDIDEIGGGASGGRETSSPSTSRADHLKSQQLEPIIKASVNRFLTNLNVKSFQVVPVQHVQHAAGVVLETKKNSFKIVFSGDCKPTEMLVKYGKNCDLLIHESTFDDALLTDAIKKKHSTVSDAINVGKMMNAKYLMLWHFSQRYDTIPYLNSVQSDQTKVSISFDNMIVNRYDLQILPQFNELLKLLFKENHDRIEKTNAKKMLKNKSSIN